MTTILFVKTSSLGDVVHNCPAVSDAARAFPGAAIDWVVEEPFAGLAAMHPAVRRVIPVAVRRWRSSLLKSSTWSEIAAWRRNLRAERYDVVVDTQSLFKSALIASQAQGKRHGLDRASAREVLAPMFYDVRHSVPRGQHAVERNRQLAAKALGYSPTHLDYGLRIPGASRSAYVVLLTMTSRDDKLWPDERWIQLARELRMPAMLPWGSEPERERAQRIASAIGGTTMPRRLGIDELASLFVGASTVIGLDTGLTHFAAALGVPTVGLYCGSDPALTGIYGAPRARNIGSRGNMPEVSEVLRLVS